MSDYVATVDAGTAAGRVIADSMGETLDRIATALEALVEQGRKPVRWEYRIVYGLEGERTVAELAAQGFRLAQYGEGAVDLSATYVWERPIYEEQEP